MNSVLNTLGQTSNTGINDIKSILNTTDAGTILNSAAHSLGLKDVYIAHVATWCSGIITSTNKTEIISCTTPAFPFSFDPITIIETDLLQGITLAQLGFDTGNAEKTINALRAAYKAMNIMYLVGTVLCALLVLTSLCGFIASRLLEALNQLVAILAFISLGAASAIATAIAVIVKKVFNENAKVINVFAENSRAFLGMTWGAVVGVLIVMMMWCAICCCCRHSSRSGRKDERAMRVEEARRETTPMSGGYDGGMNEKRRGGGASKWGKWRR